MKNAKVCLSAYWQEVSSECTRSVTTFSQATCEGTVALSAATFHSGFRVVTVGVT